MISSELKRFLYKAYRIDGANHTGRCEPHRQIMKRRTKDEQKTVRAARTDKQMTVRAARADKQMTNNKYI